ncbi:maltokinase N-terminal cap-like domain-containing protein [Actinomadura scrupuli]|uniref:maltokinase N-terminal cap-like domain-containing protein n=1 Tax=Actinomadura scrupuli TaxID=559629 RepID=UPI003D99AAEB
MRLPAGLEQSLATWLPRQRWFAGKGRGAAHVEILSGTELVPGDPGLHHLILGVRQGDLLDHYQVLVGARGLLPGRLEYAEICPEAGGFHDPRVYDAVHDPELTRVLLAKLAGDARVGDLSFHTVPGTRIETALASLASPAEQSNTSLIFGETYICKLFRRLTPGVNPDLEMNLGLSEVGCGAIPELYGWIDTTLEGEQTTLGMLSQFLSSATDGWRLATTSVRDLYAHAADRPGIRAEEAGGDFAAEAERLGAATAAVHRDLAVAFDVTRLPADEVRATARVMHDRLVEAREAVPELAPYSDLIAAAYDDLAKLDGPLPVQRIHGDYHLGQVMRTEHRWVVLDFEGEPARSLAERRAPGHPLRDVAGMLRSFEYAAQFLLSGQHSLLSGQHQPGSVPDSAERLQARAREWADRNRAAFCRGYAQAGGPDPHAHEVLLRAFEFDKAVYEVLYEARNRPSWLHIPLSGFAAHARSRGR